MEKILLALFGRYPWLAGVFGALVVAVAGYGFVVTRAEVAAMPTEPRAVSSAVALANAAHDGNWVTLSDLKILCDRRVASDRDSYVPALATDGHAIIISAHEDTACDPSTPVSGVLDESRPQLRSTVADLGLDIAKVSAQTPIYYLCTTCSAGNSQLGVYLCGIFIVLGLALYPLVRLAAKQQQKKRALAARDPFLG